MAIVYYWGVLPGVLMSVWGGCGLDRFDQSPSWGRLAENRTTQSPQLWHRVCWKKRCDSLPQLSDSHPLLLDYVFSGLDTVTILFSFSGIFPEADKDPVIQIASMVQRQGETEPFIRTVFTLQSCASIVGSQIFCFTQEKQLLQVSVLTVQKPETI